MNYWKKWNFSRVYYQQNNYHMFFAIIGAEMVKLIPEGTHEWKKLIKPKLFKNYFINNFHNFNKHGILYNPITNNWSYSIFSNINYFFCFKILIKIIFIMLIFMKTFK